MNHEEILNILHEVANGTGSYRYFILANHCVVHVHVPIENYTIV